jgi:hypothetical protein
MSSKSSSGGTSILTVLQIIFIVLKLLKVITWSWWKVFIPTWIALGLWGIIFIVLFVIKVYYKLKG